MAQGTVYPFECVAVRAVILEGGVLMLGIDADVVSGPRLVGRAVGSEEVAILAQRFDQDVRATALTSGVDEAVDPSHCHSLPATLGQANPPGSGRLRVRRPRSH